jgi:hypothetical protein
LAARDHVLRTINVLSAACGLAFLAHSSTALSAPSTVEPLCLDVFKSACPAAASFYGTVKGSCCIYPPIGFTAQCAPNVFATACKRPGDIFIGTLKGSCCSTVSKALISKPPASATCFDDTFKSACPVASGAIYYGTVKGTCCINVAPGFDTRCTANAFSTACRRPGDMFVGNVKGQCCSRVPKASSTVVVRSRPEVATPVCFDVFKTGCPSGATFFGTVKGSCCLDQAAGHTTQCFPGVFKTACNRPGDMFIGAAKGACCSRVAAPGVTGSPRLYIPKCYTVFKSQCPPTATYYGTVKGSCCIYPVVPSYQYPAATASYPTTCVPKVFKKNCNRPGDVFIGSVTGDCCSRPALGAPSLSAIG